MTFIFQIHSCNDYYEEQVYAKEFGRRRRPTNIKLDIIFLRSDGLKSFYHHPLQDILTQLRTIFDLIIDFQTAQSEFYEEANDELQARQHYEKLQQMRSQKVCDI